MILNRIFSQSPSPNPNQDPAAQAPSDPAAVHLDMTQAGNVVPGQATTNPLPESNPTVAQPLGQATDVSLGPINGDLTSGTVNAVSQEPPLNVSGVQPAAALPDFPAASPLPTDSQPASPSIGLDAMNAPVQQPSMPPTAPAGAVPSASVLEPSSMVGAQGGTAEPLQSSAGPIGSTPIGDNGTDVSPPPDEDQYNPVPGGAVSGDAPTMGV